MPIVKLTEAMVHSLTCPPGKTRVEFCDSEMPGLYVDVRASNPGTGVYYFRYKDKNGKTCHQRLGRVCDLDFPEARKLAKTLKADIIVNGADPRAEAKAEKAVLTFNEFFTNHYLPYVKPRKRSWRRDEELFRLRVQERIGNKRLNQVTRQQIQQFHTDLLSTGLAPATCDHHIKLLKHCYSMAVTWGLTDQNPASRVPLYNISNAVDHYLNDEELARLMAVLRTDRNRVVCRLIMLLLSSGTRLSEALTAKWSDIDIPNKTWRIPATNSKSKRMRSIPLNKTALEVIHELDTRDKYEYLFVNRRTGHRLTTVMKQWARIRNIAGMPHFRIHDCRHQFCSMLVSSGRTLYEVQLLAGHQDPKTTIRYSHVSSKALADAANCASVIIQGAGSKAA
jgi:integrase